MTEQIQLLTGTDFTDGNGSRRFEVYPCDFKPGFGLRCRSLMESEQTAYEMAALNKSGELKMGGLLSAKRRLIKLVAVDNDGNPFLTDDDLKAMKNADGRLINWAFKVCSAHIGLDEDELEELVGNSSTTTVDDSRSS